VEIDLSQIFCGRGVEYSRVPRPIPRKGMETQIFDFGKYHFYHRSKTYSPQGDGNFNNSAFSGVTERIVPRPIPRKGMETAFVNHFDI
jgi:hypothetical protein